MEYYNHDTYKLVPHNYYYNHLMMCIVHFQFLGQNSFLDHHSPKILMVLVEYNYYNNPVM